MLMLMLTFAIPACSDCRDSSQQPASAAVELDAAAPLATHAAIPVPADYAAEMERTITRASYQRALDELARELDEERR